MTIVLWEPYQLSFVLYHLSSDHDLNLSRYFQSCRSVAMETSSVFVESCPPFMSRYLESEICQLLQTIGDRRKWNSLLLQELVFGKIIIFQKNHKDVLNFILEFHSNIFFWFCQVFNKVHNVRCNIIFMNILSYVSININYFK